MSLGNTSPCRKCKDRAPKWYQDDCNILMLEDGEHSMDDVRIDIRVMREPPRSILNLVDAIISLARRFLIMLNAMSLRPEILSRFTLPRVLVVADTRS